MQRNVTVTSSVAEFQILPPPAGKSMRGLWRRPRRDPLLVRSIQICNCKGPKESMLCSP